MTVHRFTDRWLQSYVGPDDGRIEFVDAHCPSLHLRVSRRTKTFSAMFRLNGKLKRRTVGRYPRVTLAKAREVTLAILREADTSGVLSHPAVRSVPTYAAAVDLYEERHLRPNTRSGAGIAAGLRCADMMEFFARPVDGIAKADVIGVLDRMMARGKPQAAVNHLRRLKMLFNWLCERDVIVNSPCDRLRPPAKGVERDRVLSDDEIATVWRATYSLEKPFGEMYRMFFLTGQRRSEVATMEWSEISDDLWTIPRDKVKKDRSHAVPLGRAAQGLLAGLSNLPRFEGGDYVFTTNGGLSPSSNFCKTKRRLDELSGVAGWTIHDIRRTVRSKMAELGIPREVARKVLNHEDGKVDRIYNRHEYLAEKREALERWEKMLTILAARNASGLPLLTP